MTVVANDNKGFVDGFIVVDGIQLYYRDYSPRGGDNGMTTVCLHGLSRNSRDFEDLAPWLARRGRVIALDARGRGQSGHDPDWQTRYHPAQYVSDAWTVLDALGVDRFVVIGTSMGGIMAMLMAQQQPARVAGVVLNDVGPELDPAGIARISAYAGRQLPVSNWDEAVDQTRTNYANAWPGLKECEWLRLAQREYDDDNGVPRLLADTNIGEALREGRSGVADLWQAFDALHDIPVLVLRGEHSDILAESTVLAMQRRHATLRAITVANRGHAPLLNEKEVLDALQEFLGCSV